MKITIQENGRIIAQATLIERIFGVKPETMKKLIASNPVIRKNTSCDTVLFWVRPWECPGGSGPAMIAYGKCVPTSFREEWVNNPANRDENGIFVMYEHEMVKSYYGF